jgi:hypothetical protein
VEKGPDLSGFGGIGRTGSRLTGALEETVAALDNKRVIDRLIWAVSLESGFHEFGAVVLFSWCDLGTRNRHLSIVETDWAKDFPIVQSVQWSKLPSRIFTPLGLALAGSIALIWYHPQASPGWAIWGNLACQLASHVLTAI